jgi:hypothetical protein
MGHRRVPRGDSRSRAHRGDLDACRASLWAALKDAADELAATQGPDPAAWHADAVRERIRFRPGLLGEQNSMRWANRPTYQQLLEFK